MTESNWKMCKIKRVVEGSSYFSGCSINGYWYEETSSQIQILTEKWSRVVAVPYIIYMSEINRILMLIACDYPHRAMLLFSDNLGETWSNPEYMHKETTENDVSDYCVGLTYLGNGKAMAYDDKFIWLSTDYGKTWDESTIYPKAIDGNSPFYGWDPMLVDIDAQTGNKRLTLTGYTPVGEFDNLDYYSQGLIRFSNDEGINWSKDVEVPQWRHINEVAVIRAANGDMVAACRTDGPREYRHLFFDHKSGLGISISKDNGNTWSDVNILYEFGRHHPSMVLMPDGNILMTYVVRLGYPDTEDGFKQFGIEALISNDHGKTWDTEKRYILAKWQANSKGKNYWWASSQATSSVLLPDGNILTAYGTGYRSHPNENGMPAPRDVGLVKWKPE